MGLKTYMIPLDKMKILNFIKQWQADIDGDQNAHISDTIYLVGQNEI